MRTTRLLRIVVVCAVAIAAAILLAAASASLTWHSEHDSPLMTYAGFLVAGGSVPYRDLFDMNMPGTYLVMAAMGRVLGWDDPGFRVFDLLCLAIISAATFLWTRRFGNVSAAAASIAFPLWYLNAGSMFSMQREYIALVPFAGMLAVATADEVFQPWLQVLAVGTLAGMTATIKPQFLLLSLPLLVFLLQSSMTTADVRGRVAAFAAGVAIPVGAMFLYLLRTGSLGSFLDIAVNYWPLYSHLNGDHTPISGLPRLVYLVRSTVLGLVTVYTPMAVMGLIVLDGDRAHKRHAWMMGGLLAVAAFYPAVSGQFWHYHWIPFQYVALCGACMPLRLVPSTGSRDRVAPALGAVFLLALLSAVSVRHLSRPQQGTGGEQATADEISGFLRSHMEPGDTVQPLDWTGGAVHAMLTARAPLATRFMYDFHFYHHVSSPYIQKLRQDFIGELVASNPRFVVQIVEGKSWPTGPDTTREFPELQAILERRYATARQGATYRILQRIDGSSVTGPTASLSSWPDRTENQ